MKQSEKLTIASGVLFLLGAAIFIISLMLHFLDYGVALPYFFDKCQNFGSILFSIYGISSFLIPVYLFVAAIFLFLPTWTFKRGFYLSISLIPFFTVVGIERFCDTLFTGTSSAILLIKYSTFGLVSILLVVIEYLIAGIISDVIIAKKLAKHRELYKKQVANAVTSESEKRIDENSVESGEILPVETDEELEIQEIMENTETIEILPEENSLGYGELKSEVVDIPNIPEEIPCDETKNEESQFIPEEDIDSFSNEEKVKQEEDSSNQEEIIDPTLEDTQDFTTDKKRITPEEIDALLAPGLDDYLDEPEVIQMDFNTDDKPEMIILPQEGEESMLPEDLEIQNSEILAEEKKGGLLSSAMKLRNKTDSQTENLENISETPVMEEENLDYEKVETSVEAALSPDEEFDKLVFGDDQELKKEFFSEDEQNFLNNPFGEDPNNPFAFLGEAGKDIQIEEDDFSEESDEIGAFEFEMDDSEITENSDNQDDFDLSVEDENISIEFDSEEIEENSMNCDLEAMDDFDSDEDEIDETEIDEAEDEILDENQQISNISTYPIKKNYNIPIEGVLASYQNNPYWIIDEETKQAGVILKETLNEFKIEAEVTGIRKGPVITMFEILPAPGVKLNRIVTLQDNIALRLAAQSVRIVAPIPGKHAVGIEVPNKERAVVSFRELIEKELPQFDKMKIPVVLGKDISGDAQLLDLATTPHLLIAGSTGSGKSVCVNSMILSILYKRSPRDVKMILIDPKIVELKLYNDIPHLLTPVITEPKKAFQALQYCLCEMERRYAMLDHMGVRDISTYNKRIKERHLAQEEMPYIVVIIDEFADLMATTGKELESTVARLAAMSRAVGIHLVLATQRPSIDVITGLIKANIPTRIAFMVASKTDSRIIIDQVGSEKLLGKGDMLYSSAIDPFPVRIQGTFVTEDEVEKVVECVKAYGEPEYIDEEIFVEDEDDETSEPGLFSEGADPLYDRALEIVVQAGKASASYIQRRLKIGYNRAARLVEEMEARGIVGPANGSKPREIIHIP